MTPAGSLSICGLGVLLQIVMYLISIAVVVRFNNHPVIEPVMLGVMTVVMFFMPLLGILGIVVGVKCYRHGIGKLLPLFGIVMNTLWLALLAAVCYMVFVLQVTA